MPKLAALHSRNNNFVLMTVSADQPEQESEAFAFLKQSGVAMPAYIKRVGDDRRFIDSIDPKWSGALPALFLYDRQGKKLKAFIGETDMADLEAALRAYARKADLH